MHEREREREREREMVSKEHKRAALHEKLQLLRAATHSHAHTKASIIVDASKYIEELKQKVDRLNQEIAWARRPKDKESFTPWVNVETLQNGYLIDVFLQKSCPGLLVSILEAFEELGLSTLQARAACTDTFRLQAVGGEQFGNLNAQAVKQAVVHAIESCSASNDQD